LERLEDPDHDLTALHGRVLRRGDEVNNGLDNTNDTGGGLT